MPVELSERELRDAIAVVGEWNREGAQAAQSAFEWMGWEGEEPLFLRRYDVQLFVWYVLPRKYLVGLDDKEAVAAALAKTLERLGGQAAGYAEVCRAPETQRLLRAWEAEDPVAPRTFRDLLGRSGIEPPDTDLLAWGSVMGFEEARIREQVATALEEAIESGDLRPGSRGFARHKAEVAKAALREPWDGEDGRSRLHAVQDERLEGWLQRGAGADEQTHGAPSSTASRLRCLPSRRRSIPTERAWPSSPLSGCSNRETMASASPRRALSIAPWCARWRSAGRTGGRPTSSALRIAKTT